MASFLTVLNCVQCVVIFFFLNYFPSFTETRALINLSYSWPRQQIFTTGMTAMPLTDHTNHLFINSFTFSNDDTVGAPNYNAKTMLGHPSLAFWNYVFIYVCKVNQSHYRPEVPREGSRKLRFPDYVTMAQDGGKVVRLTHRTFTPRKYSWYSFLLEAESTPRP